MSDPVGNLQYCFTPLACMLTCVCGNTSPITTVMYKEFGDPYCHPPCTATLTLSQLTSIQCDPQEFWDHNICWCIQALGSAELDFQFSIILPITGFPHFSNGIMKLKQFWYFSQAPTITSIMHDKIKCALQEFHDHKHAIIEGGLHCGQQTNAILEHWHIPKLELMQSVAPSIKHISSLLQWSADTTEHAHIKVIKDPASATNNHNYESQICRYLDHLEKCQCFDTAVSLHKFAHPVPQQTIESGLHNDSDAESTQEDIADNPNPTLPFLTFIAGLTAIHLNSSPSLCHIPINHVAQIFNLPDLHGALSDYLNHKDVHLPFKDLHVWFQVCLQQKSYHDPSSVSLTFSVHTHPPNNKWNHGCYDAAILNVDQEAEWSLSSLWGHAVIHVHPIMHPVSPRGTVNPFTNCFLMYVQQFNIVPQANGSVVESYAHIVPHFDHTADNWLTTSNSIHFLQSFFLNKYFDKDFFYAIS
ncbi:hypothetical protein V8B97DRAFT_2023518 [Scleroderma yunnanense]